MFYFTSEIRTMENRSVLNQFRVIALLEGLSFIVLLFVAMPLKYVWNMPMAVKFTGMAHGLLFVAYVAWLMVCHLSYHWQWKFSVGAFLASLVPFGTFVLDRKLAKL
jgi:integral membrane protein